MARRVAGLVSLAVIALVLSPVVQNWRKKPQDSFPLSYFPMFTLSRGDSIRVNYLEGRDSEGRSRRLHYSVAGNGGLNQVRRQIAKMQDEGRADQLCAAVAANVAQRSGRRYRDIVEVRLVSGRFNFDEYFLEGKKKPSDKRVCAKCRVDRTIAVTPESGVERAAQLEGSEP